MTLFTDRNRSRNSREADLYLPVQPTAAWVAILGLILLTGLGILAGGRILRPIFPLASFAVGVFLYQRYFVLYIGFTWWIWFLTPLVRRLIDYRAGYEDQSIVLITPFLVTFICCLPFFRYLLNISPSRQDGLPFILGFAGVFYTFLLSLANILDRGFNILLVRSMIEWSTPIMFGFYLFYHWRDYPRIRENIERTFFGGAVVIGIYGLVQFCLLPPWDRLWQENVLELGFGNVGTPAPFLVSIWSTLNTPGVLANVMIPCILLLFNSKNSLRIPVATISILVLLLANNRTSWGGFVVGTIALIGTLKSHLQIRIILVTLVILLCVFPLATMEPFSSKIADRVQTLSDVQEDYSFQARQDLYNHLLDDALVNPIGHGMNSLNLADSGVLVVFYEMGWLGSLFYASGYISLFVNLFWNVRAGGTDPFLVAARSASLGLFVMVPNGNILTALPGILIWSLAGIVMAGNKYYRHQADESVVARSNARTPT